MTLLDGLPHPEVVVLANLDTDTCLDEGTGIVHIAPGCGDRDFEISQQGGAHPCSVPVDEGGHLSVPGLQQSSWDVSAHEVPDIVAAHLERGRLAPRARGPGPAPGAGDAGRS